MGRKLLLLFITTFLLVLPVGCNSSSEISIPKQAELKLSESDQLRLERATPTSLLELYVEGINNNNPYLTIATFSSSYFKGDKTLENLKTDFTGMKIDNVKIVEDEQKNVFKNENEFNLVISYTLEFDKEASTPNGEGEYYYFVKCVKESNNIWKINNLATSP